MKISREEVEHVALLARLAISSEEKDMFTEQLNVILEYVDQLNELDTTDVKPTSHVIPVKNVMREDQVETHLTQEEALKNAPEKEEGYIKVPRIV